MTAPAPEKYIHVQFTDANGRPVEGKKLPYTYPQFRRFLIGMLHTCRSVKPGYEDDPLMLAYLKSFQESCLAAASAGAVDPNDALSWISLSKTPYTPEERARLMAPEE